MSLPTLSLTWQYAINQFVAPQGTILTTNRRLLRTIKNVLLAFATNAPTVNYSSNGTAPGTGTAGDGVDRWSADSDVIWGNAGSAHSWFVFRMAQVGATFDLLISCEGSSGTGQTLTVVGSYTGFSGGTSTARPTAADEFIISAGIGALPGTEPGVGFRFHVLYPTDGKQIRIVNYSSGAQVFGWMLGVASVPSGITWTTPFWGYITTTAATNLDTSANWLTSGAKGKARGNGGTMDLFFTGEGWGSTSFAGNVRIVSGNDFAGGAQDLLPIGLASETAGSVGRVGQVVDVWWGVSTNTNADTFPNDASRQFVMHGDMVWPNDGSIIQTT